MIALDLHISTFFLLYVLITIIEYVIWKRQERKIYFLAIMVLTLYLMLLFKVGICPITYLRPENRQEFTKVFGDYIQYYQLVPFKTIISNFQNNVWISQVLGNVILLFPVPLLYSFLVKEIPGRKTLIFLGAMVSLSIEIIQFGIDVIGHYPSHVADIDDFILNTVGVTVSTIVLYFIQEKEFYSKIKQRFRKEEICMQ